MRTLGVLVFPEFELLDVFGPLEVFGHRLVAHHYRVCTVAAEAGPVRSAQGPRVLADHGFVGGPPLDVLLVPGGMGTRREVDNANILRWITATAAVAAAEGFGAQQRAGEYWLCEASGPARVLVLDRFADPVATVLGEIVPTVGVDEVTAAVARQTRHRGPVTLTPTVWVIDGSHLLELTSSDAVAAAAGSAAGAAAVVGRPES